MSDEGGKKLKYEGATRVMKEVEKKGSKASVGIVDVIHFNEYAKARGIGPNTGAEEAVKKLRTPTISNRLTHDKFENPDEY